MIPNLILLDLALCLCSIFPTPSAMFLQSPGFAAGKLVVQSSPNQGASISIDGRPFQQPTNATFVVSPGNHKVEVSGGPDSLANCSGEKSKIITVSEGGTVTLTCGKSGWQ